MSSYYFVLALVPDEQTPAYEQFYCGVAGVWIRQDLGKTQSEARAQAEQSLRDLRWSPIEFVLAEEVTSESYELDADGRAEYEQSIRQGIALHVRRVAKEVLTRDDVEPEGARRVERYRESTNALRGTAFSLYSDADEQWAVGVTPNGGDFCPVWSTAGHAQLWTEEYWPGYAPRMIDPEGLSTMLLGLAEDDYCVAVGDGRALVTYHPLRVARDLTPSPE